MNQDDNFDDLRKELLRRYEIVVEEYMKFLAQISDDKKEELIKWLGDEATANQYREQELKRFDDELKIMSLLIARGKPI